MKKRGFRRVLFVLLALFVAGVLFILVSVYLSANAIVVTVYGCESPKIEKPIDLLLLTDMHTHSFQEGNARLLRRVAKEAPDVILIAGDALNWYSESHDYVTNLVERLSRIAPVYFTVGNHDAKYMTQSQDYGLLDEIEQAGAAALNAGYVDVVVKGQKLRIGGLYDFVFNRNGMDEEAYRQTEGYRFLAGFEDTDDFKLLLAHQPNFLLDDAPEARWDIDLAVCGHEHGGQVRIPFYGGFYSTHLGWFSPYLDGAHLINGIPTVISRGLGTYTKGGYRIVPPRFCNIPELVRIELR